MITPREWKQISNAIRSMHTYSLSIAGGPALVEREHVMKLLRCWLEDVSEDKETPSS